MAKKISTIEERIAVGLHPFKHPDSVHVALSKDCIFRIPYFKALIELESQGVDIQALISQVRQRVQPDALRIIVDATWSACQLRYPEGEHRRYLRKLRRVAIGVPVTSCDLELELQTINDKHYKSQRMGLAPLGSEPKIDTAKTMADLGAMLTEPNVALGWQSNIAMAFQDEYVHWKKSSKKRSPSNSDIHVISNASAQRFLSLITKRG